MKKMKFDVSKVNGLLLQHVEKIVLGVVVLVAAYVVYAGYSLPKFDGGKAPDDLKKLSESSSTFIRNPETWTKIQPVRVVPNKLDEQLEKATAPNIDTAYRLPMPWKKPDFPRLAPRVDPKLFAPINIKVVPVMGPLAYIDPNTGMAGGGEGYGMSGVSTTIDPLDPVPEEEDDKPKKPKPKKKRPNRLLGEGMPAIEEEMMPPVEGSGYPGMGGMGPGGVLSNVAGPIHPEADRGYRPSMGAISKAGQAMVILAVVPYEKQIEEYEKSLSESLEYNPMRDSPRYLMFHVERADVTEGDDPAKIEWRRLNTNAAKAEMRMWAGTPGEISDPLYLDPIPGANSGGAGMPMPSMSAESYQGGSGMAGGTVSHNWGVLTHPAPPFMLRDIWDMLTHPDVPLMKLTSTTGYPNSEMGPGMPGMPGAPGTRLGPDGKPLPPEEDDFPGIGLPQPGAMNQPGFGGYPNPYGSAGMPYGEGSGMPGMSGMADPNARPKYKLLRFTDTGVEQGRKYRYRLKVFLEDPNYPLNFPAPPPVSLDNEVQDRVKKLMASDAKAAAKRPGWKTYWRESDWSEASEAVALPPAERFLALSADPPVLSTILPDRPGVPSTQPDAKILTVIWDPTKAADLAAEEEIYRGSLVRFVAEAWAVHPVKLEVRSLPKIEFNTASIVADIQGGENIPTVRKATDALKSPAEVLVFDAQGNLSVEDETDDIEDVRRFKPMELPKTQDPMMSPEGGYYEELMSPPGPGPSRGPRRGRNQGSP